MEPIDLLLTARWILPISPNNIILEKHAIAIRADKIVDLLPLDEAQQQYYAEQYIELKDHVLMPGLVNAHTHTPMNLFRGLADDLPLMDWLQHHIWPAEKLQINAISAAAGTRLAIAEMLRGGITCFNDHYFFHEAIAATAVEEGMRAAIGLVVLNVETASGKNEQDYLNRAVDTLKMTTALPGISWTIAPHAPYTVSNKSLEAIHTLSEQYQLPIHMHIHETEYEIEESLKQYGVRPLERLHQLKLLSPKLLAVHMTQLTAAEIDLVAQTGTHVVHCPESNLKLASGFAPISALLQSGANIAIGTDGAASNNDLDLFGEIRTAAFLAKGLSKDPTTLPAQQALSMATINGAKALGLGDQIGSLEPGKYADIIGIDLSSYLTQPIYNPFSHLVYAINRLQVKEVWINGKHLLKRGEFTRLDPNKTIADAKQWCQPVEMVKI